MKYTEEFKKEVREVYGDEFNTMLESGNEFLGRYLNDSSSSSISIKTILEATSLEELKKKAKLEQRKVNLYNSYWNQPKS